MTILDLLNSRLPKRFDGSPAHSFAALMSNLATIVRNTCRTSGSGPEGPTFEVLTTPTAAQVRALDLVRGMRL